MQVQRLAGSNKIPWWIRAILSRRVSTDHSHRYWQLSRLATSTRGGSVAIAQADTAAAMGSRKNREAWCARCTSASSRAACRAAMPAGLPWVALHASQATHGAVRSRDLACSRIEVILVEYLSDSG